MQFSRWNLNITCTCNKAILKLMISAFWFDSFEISLLDAYVKKQPVYDAEQIFALACINEFDWNIKELSTKIHFKVNDVFIKQYSDIRCFIKGWIQTLLREMVKNQSYINLTSYSKTTWKRGTINCSVFEIILSFMVPRFQ